MGKNFSVNKKLFWEKVRKGRGDNKKNKLGEKVNDACIHALINNMLLRNK